MVKYFLKGENSNESYVSFLRTEDVPDVPATTIEGSSSGLNGDGVSFYLLGSGTTDNLSLSPIFTLIECGTVGSEVSCGKST